MRILDHFVLRGAVVMSKKLRKEARLIERLFLGGQWTPFIARWSQAMGNKALHNRQSWIEITCRRYVQLTLLVEPHNNNPPLPWPAIFNALLSSAPSWTLQCFWCHYSSPIPSNGPIKWTFHGLWVDGVSYIALPISAQSLLWQNTYVSSKITHACTNFLDPYFIKLFTCGFE